MVLEGAAGSAGRTESTSVDAGVADTGDDLFRLRRGPRGCEGDVMSDLPARPNLDQLRHQAKDLLHAAQQGDAEALSRVVAVAGSVRLSAAQLAVAREYGFSSWAALKLEVERRDILDRGDVARLVELLTAHPELAIRRLAHWSDGNRNRPLAYVTKMRFYHDQAGAPADVSGTGALARALLAAGAPVNGRRRDKETPLITAASYGDAEVARVLIEAGADLDTTSAPDAGGVPGGSALLHAAVFGMTEIVDLLVAAGARA
ncbi:MAG: ankyrin repeat domain-containing protein, partial [Actinobacteria bacterium]|nr:ankyrin repeat domain-containing protein [Actinomycetota bacterium]